MNLGRVTKIIVHCSATREGDDSVTASVIDTWHKSRGFKKIGYHFVVLMDGTIELGRMINEVGAHVQGHNDDSIGICYIGGVEKDGRTPKDTRTYEQKESLIVLIKTLKKTFPDAAVYGHRDFAAKACPSFDAKSEYSRL